MSFARILIASADDATAEFVDRKLREWGYAPDRVIDGAEAVRILTEGDTPRIAFLDMTLTGISGLEVAARVHHREFERPVWKLLMSDDVDLSMISDARDAGVDDLVLKPLDPVDLRIRLTVAERVQALLNQLDSEAQAARFHAKHDKLTGLWNRESLLRMLAAETDRAQRTGSPLALVLLDLDHFSRVNRDYTYEVGDKILRELARRLRRSLRSYDLIARYGEDEFLIALPGCTSEQAFDLVRRVKRAIFGRPFRAGVDLLTMTASTGISHSTGRSRLTVLREVESALDAAKQDGRNCERLFSTTETEPVQERGSAMHLVQDRSTKG